MACIVQSLLFYELDCSFIVQLTILNICKDIHSPRPENELGMLAEYPPQSLVILGSRICWNSLDACATAAAETSATMVAASCGLPVFEIGILLTSKVQFNST